MAVSSSTQIAISWTAVTGADTLDLYWAAGATVDTTSSTNAKGLSGTLATKMVTGLPSNTAYAFLLVANNVGGSTLGTVLATGTAPVAPSITPPVNITMNTVSFTYPTVTGATEYRIYSKASASAVPTVTTADTSTSNGTSLSYNSGSITNTSYYAFMVTAKNTWGESDPSTTQTVMPTPSGLSAIAAMPLTWYWPGGADLTNLTGSSQSFLIQSSSDNATWANFTTVTIANTFSNSYVKAGPPAMVNSDYYRIAHSSAGVVDGFISSSTQATVP